MSKVLRIDNHNEHFTLFDHNIQQPLEIGGTCGHKDKSINVTQ